ncbi:MAG: dipeptidase [Bacteroidales bacterium]|nr:dipeptidase [Bacteroidales bacterium]MCU0407419.1 dipeptidase [Bacteroidales bacterium]
MKKSIALSIPVLLLLSCGTPEERLVSQADRLHASILTVDTHCDTPMEFTDSTFDLGVRRDEGCVDFPRMKEGGLHAEFFAVFIGQGPRNDTAYDKVHANALKIFDALHKNISKNSSLADIALTANDAYRIKKDGRIAAFIGVENGYPAGRDISRIRQYYELGARYLTLSHTSNNDICDSSTDRKGPEHGGLSAFGEEVVKEMNSLGMMVDVSHISDEAFYDVLQVTKAPVLASHSSCRALCGSPRNLTDDMLLALKENGGVIQICILSDYLKAPEPNPERDQKLKDLQDKYGDYSSLPDSVKKIVRQEYRDIQKRYEKLATVSDVVDHIDHVVQVAGIDYVGIGTDFDGGGRVEGCSNVSEMKNITIELLRRGYSKGDIEKIWGANIMRVLRKCEDLAASS